MIDLYVGNTGNAMRAVLILEECGLPYRRHVLDIAAKEHKTADYFKVNPVGQVPAMIDHEPTPGSTEKLVIAQSGAIMLYAAEKADSPLLPKDPVKKALVMQWVFAALTDIHALLRVVRLGGEVKGEGAAQVVQIFEDMQTNYLMNIQRQLGSQTYILGEPTLADVTLYPLFRMRKDHYAKLGQFEPLIKWCDNFSRRPAVIRAYSA